VIKRFVHSENLPVAQNPPIGQVHSKVGMICVCEIFDFEILDDGAFVNFAASASPAH
jgi:hypothetical protein